MADAAANPAATPVLRSQLLDRRDRLEAAREVLPENEVTRLLAEVDHALARMDKGTYGLCEFCHDTIEEERLAADPLTCYCIDHLSAPERHALQQDLDTAVQVQASLLPSRNISHGEWEACYHYEPHGAVSGDFCDLQPTDGRLFFLVGDVAGKGVSASLLMAHLHAIFRSLLSVGMPITELLERANRLFCDVARPPHYATLIAGFADNSGEVELCNAGHCAAIIIRDGQAVTVPAGGVPVGLFCGAHYPSARLRLERGESLVLYTDGVTEARNAVQDEYGTARLVTALRQLQGVSSADLTRGCLADVRAFLAGAAKGDDLTIMAVRRRP